MSVQTQRRARALGERIQGRANKAGMGCSYYTMPDGGINFIMEPSDDQKEDKSLDMEQYIKDNVISDSGSIDSIKKSHDHYAVVLNPLQEMNDSV